MPYPFLISWILNKLGMFSNLILRYWHQIILYKECPGLKFHHRKGLNRRICHFGHSGRVALSLIEGIAGSYFALAFSFKSYQDHAISRPGTINGRRCTLQYRYRFNRFKVIGINSFSATDAYMPSTTTRGMLSQVVLLPRIKIVEL